MERMRRRLYFAYRHSFRSNDYRISSFLRLFRMSKEIF